ncbi:MAG TPA: hypothetical protein VGN12_20290 [Pirellulales bacterium]|jgi:hypothetical protein
MLRFYGEFAAAFGTLVLSVFAFALLAQQDFRTGMPGFIMMILVALAYAIVRTVHRESLRHEREILAARARRESPS